MPITSTATVAQSALRPPSSDVVATLVEEALASQTGHLWYAASSRGRTTYTAFITTRDRLIGAPEPLLRMVKAIFRHPAMGPCAACRGDRAGDCILFPEAWL